MRRAPLVAAPTFQSRQKIMRGMWRRLPSTWRNNWGGWVRSVRQKFSTLRHSPSDQGARQARCIKAQETCKKRRHRRLGYAVCDGPSPGSVIKHDSVGIGPIWRSDGRSSSRRIGGDQLRPRRGRERPGVEFGEHTLGVVTRSGVGDGPQDSAHARHSPGRRAARASPARRPARRVPVCAAGGAVDCPNNSGLRDQRQVRFCHWFSGLFLQAVP